MPGLPGDPAAVEVAADGLARAAQRLVEVRDAVAAHGRAVGESWHGNASTTAMVAVEGAATGTLTLAETSQGASRPLRGLAGELRRAQQDWADGQWMAQQGEALVVGTGSGVPADAARERGRVAMTDGFAIMESAADRARIARETAARALDEAATALAGLAPAPPLARQPDGDAWDGLRKAAGDVVDEVGGTVGGVIDHVNLFGDRFGDTWSNTYQTAQAAVTDPLAAGTAIVQGTVEPLVDSYRSGGWDEALGRSPGVIAAALGGKGLPKLGPLAHLRPDPDPGAHTPLAPGGGLQRHEDAGGHTLDPARGHVGASDQDLLDRQTTRRTPFETSTYTDRETVERAVHENLAANQAAIDRWLQSNPTEPQRFELGHVSPIGRLAPSGAPGLADVIDATTSRVVLRPDPSMPGGYYILTSYPRP